jgi:phosphatidylethanolamine-binding protein (PEBP) family uncharacterized protein
MALSLVQTQPKIKYESKSTETLYTLIMHDPDAPSGNFLHWVVVNIHDNNISSGKVLIPYFGPSPPKGQKHKYKFLLFEQNEIINAQKIVNRSFPMNKLFNKLTVKLHLVASTYFKSQNLNGGRKNKITKKKKIFSRKNKTRKNKTRKNKT